MHRVAPPRVRAGRPVLDLARSGRPAAVNYRVVYRWFVCWRISPFLSRQPTPESLPGNGEGAHHKKWWFCLLKSNEEKVRRDL